MLEKSMVCEKAFSGSALEIWTAATGNTLFPSSHKWIIIQTTQTNTTLNYIHKRKRFHMTKSRPNHDGLNSTCIKEFRTLNVLDFKGSKFLADRLRSAVTEGSRLSSRK